MLDWCVSISPILGEEVLTIHANINNSPITVLNEMYLNRRNSRAVQETVVEEHDGDVRFKTISGNSRFARCRLLCSSWSRCTGSQPTGNYKSSPGGRLPLLSARPVVTFPAAERHRLLAGTKLYCLVTEARRCEQLAQGCYAAISLVGFEPTTCWSQVQCSTRYATQPPC